jgi:hypothetical protein
MTMVVRLTGSRRPALGANKAYDVHGFVDDLRDLNVAPHIARNTTSRTSAIDARTNAPPRLCDQSAEAQANRGAVRLRQDDRPTRPADVARSGPFTVQIHSEAYDLIRMPTLLEASA